MIGNIIAVNKGLSIQRINKLQSFVLSNIENQENPKFDNVLHFLDILLEQIWDITSNIDERINEIEPIDFNFGLDWIPKILNKMEASSEKS